MIFDIQLDYVFRKEMFFHPIDYLIRRKYYNGLMVCPSPISHIPKSG
jgi:hypothetical protein